MKDYRDIEEKIISEGYDCGTGSWSVVTDKIVMKLNEYGEYVPVVSSSLDNDEIRSLESISQIMNTHENEDSVAKDLYSDIPGINYDSRLGYYLDTYIGHVVEGNYRKNASSGGFGTWIFKELLEKKYIDGVIHVKKSLSDSLLFEYAISNTIEEVVEGAKTKYYPVEFSKVLKEIKEKGGRYAVIGLPAHIFELRLLMKYDKELAEQSKFTIGLICGHQKTSKFADFLAWQCGIEPGKLVDINFRYKIANQPANQYGIEVSTKNEDGETVVVRKKMNELFGVDWGQGFFKVRGSDFTDDVMIETADITLGDAWLPEYTVDSGGNNVIIVRNEELKKIIDEGIKAGKVKLDKVSKDKIFASQESHYRHTHDELSYRLQKQIDKGNWAPSKRVSPSTIKVPFIRKKIQDSREDISEKSHIYFLEAEEKLDLNFFTNKMMPLTQKYRNLYRLEAMKKKGVKGCFKSLMKKIIK